MTVIGRWTMFNNLKLQARKIWGNHVFTPQNLGKAISLAKSATSLLAEYDYRNAEEKAATNSPILTQNPPHKPFGLANMSQAARYWQALYGRGHTLKCNYRVFLKPFGSNGTVELPIFNQLYVGNPLLGFLATDVEIPLLGAGFEQKRMGVYNVSRLSEFDCPEFNIRFLETKNQAFLKSLMMYRTLMVNDDGTINPPAYYALKLAVQLYGAGELASDGVIVNELVVAISLDSLQGLSSTDYAPLDLLIGFHVINAFV